MSTTKNIEAKAGKGDNVKEFVQEFDWPEDLNEAISMFGEEEVFSMYCQQKVVRLQASIRNPGTRKTTSTYGVYKKLLDRGMDDKEARLISEYQGNADGSSEDSGDAPAEVA